jgi:hypothetical protein
MLNKQRKRFKGFLVLLLKGFAMFIFITIMYKGLNISIKLKLELIIKEGLV